MTQIIKQTMEVEKKNQFAIITYFFILEAEKKCHHSLILLFKKVLFKC